MDLNSSDNLIHEHFSLSHVRQIFISHGGFHYLCMLFLLCSIKGLGFALQPQCQKMIKKWALKYEDIFGPHSSVKACYGQEYLYEKLE